MEDDRHYLVLMNQCIVHIEEFTKKGRPAFMESMAIRHAVLWNLELLSVAARRLSKQEKEEHPQVDWDHLCNLSRQVIGNPWEVDEQKVWECVENETPALMHQIREILISRLVK